MGRGKAIPEAVQWIVIRLSTAMSEEDIAMYTDISTRSVRKILAYFKQTGDVDTPKRGKNSLHRAMCDYDIQVPTSKPFTCLLMSFMQHLNVTLNQTPDLYLDELQLELQ